MAIYLCILQACFLYKCPYSHRVHMLTPRASCHTRETFPWLYSSIDFYRENIHPFMTVLVALIHTYVHPTVAMVHVDPTHLDWHNRQTFSLLLKPGTSPVIDPTHLDWHTLTIKLFSMPFFLAISTTWLIGPCFPSILPNMACMKRILATLLYILSLSNIRIHEKNINWPDWISVSMEVKPTLLRTAMLLVYGFRPWICLAINQCPFSSILIDLLHYWLTSVPYNILGNVCCLYTLTADVGLTGDFFITNREETICTPMCNRKMILISYHINFWFWGQECSQMFWTYNTLQSYIIHFDGQVIVTFSKNHN